MTVNSKPVVNLKSVFSDKSFLKNLFIIAVPIILQNFISSFVNILDTIMIGRLGTIELDFVRHRVWGHGLYRSILGQKRF